MIPRGPRFRLACSAIVLGLLTAAGTVSAQSITHPVRIEQANFERFCADLRLDDSQRELAEVFYAEYVAKFDRLDRQLNDAMAVSRERLTELQRDSGSHRVQEQVQLASRINQIRYDAADEANELVGMLAQEVLALLPADEHVTHEHAVRGLRRRTYFENPWRQGPWNKDLSMDVDVVGLVEQAAEPGGELEGILSRLPGAAVTDEELAAAVDELVNEYERRWYENHVASFVRNRALSHSVSMALNRRDWDAYKRWIDERAKRRRATLQGQNQLISTIAAILHHAQRHEQAESLTLRWKKANFPITMQDETPEIMAKWMLDESDPLSLTDSQRNAVETILREYIQRRDPLRERAMRFAVRYHQYLGGGLRALWPQREDEPAFYEELESIPQERVELSQATSARLRALLRPDQARIFDAKFDRVLWRHYEGEPRI